MQLQCSSFYYQAKPDPMEPVLRKRLRELDGVQVRFGYRRLATMLRREGWLVNAKRIFRQYRKEGLGLSRRHKKKRVAKQGGPIIPPVKANQLWSMDFVTDRFESGRMFRILALTDAYTRKALRIWAEVGMSGTHVATQLTEVCKGRPRPEAIRVDNGCEFYSKAMDAWAYQNQLRLDFVPRESRSKTASSRASTDDSATSA